MSYAFWKLKLVEWRARYGAPAPPVKGNGDPSRVKVLASSCARCGSRKKVHRHHKGNEFFLACIDEHFAARYIEFRAEDTVPLCRKHHAYIHTRYQELEVEVKLWGSASYNLYLVGLERYRLRFIAICDNWLAKPYKGK